MTDLTASAMLEAPTVGRSLWGDAWARLKANRAAMVSLFYLVLVTIVCIVGPMFVPHQYTTIYSDYVRTPPSLSSYPQAEMIEGALTEVVKRMRVDLQEWHQDGNRIFMTLTSDEKDRRAQCALCRPFRHLRRRQDRGGLAGRHAHGDERRDQAAVFPVRHRQCRPRSAVANADGRAHLAGDRAAGRHRRRGRSACFTALLPGFLAARPTRS